MVDLTLEYRFLTAHEILWFYTQLKNSEMTDVHCHVDFDVMPAMYKAIVRFTTSITLPFEWYKRLFFSDNVKKCLYNVSVGVKHTDSNITQLFKHGGKL